MIKGVVRLHDGKGDVVEVAAGHAGIIPPNFVGIFEMVEAVEKYYVIVEV